MENNITSPAQALIKNQDIISGYKPEIENLIRAVGRTGDLWPSQWIQLISFVYEFRPDLILELGRGYGNSTCAFNEVCRLMKPDRCVVMSLCISDDWESHTAPNLQKIIPPDWFETLRILNADILTFDFGKALENKKRVVVFWDAHGFDIAEVVLGTILPLLKNRANLIIMHDLSDARYIGDNVRYYGNERIWRGRNDWTGPKIQIGHISSCVEQAVAAIDFCSRNGLALHSSDESYHTEISATQWEALTETLGGEYISRNGHWFWFSLNEASVELTFPGVKAKPPGDFCAHSFLKRIFPVHGNKYGERTGQVPDGTDIWQLPEETDFQIRFDQTGDNVAESLETNFYNDGKRKDAVSRSRRGTYITPTSPADHLATPFFEREGDAGGRKKFVRITLFFNSPSSEEINCKIYLQDGNFNMISKNILSDPGTVYKNGYASGIVPLDETVTKYRLIINLEDGKTTVLPQSIRIEESCDRLQNQPGL